MRRTTETIDQFEIGVREYFNECGHRLAKEKTHQMWLGAILSRHISVHRIVAEFDVPMREVIVDSTAGLANFDFAIAKEEGDDLRQFWTRHSHKRDETDEHGQLVRMTQQTLNDLSNIDVIAEMKTATTTSVRAALRVDMLKLCGAMEFLKRNGASEFPQCFFIVFDQRRGLSVAAAWSEVRTMWPDGVPALRILQGPPYERLICE